MGSLEYAMAMAVQTMACHKVIVSTQQLLSSTAASLPMT